MSVWVRLGVLDKVRAVLGAVPIVNPSGHHFGRPFITAYQLAIKLDAAYPDVADELKVEIGGSGVGKHNSLAQYLAGQLSRRISERGATYPVEGAFLSKELLTSLQYTAGDKQITGSLNGYDLSMFRLRA
ncbi:hypothetical protein ADK67_45075 [Saccharothrix sp. NRRL B-16348]|uniref:hypothetical protein n=1 Tax=Saccharothrix sp. NRRL B-16348 TaxID=1415542 RepID=UPI0006AEA04E|nr:hypothetical protein [Saccharothrix sp. NRRL B-16348]KOX12798.1 hypothetical protein ADK67_45075 [Saccharothrix sp. NRRL B-16348]